MYRNHVAAFEQRNQQMAVAFLTRAWEMISATVLGEAWTLDDNLKWEDE
jgi:hypothetical protein